MPETGRAGRLQVAGIRVARAFGHTHAALTATGAAALEVALTPLVRGAGSEVVVPDEACHRVAASVVRVGARPVFVAVDRSLVLAADAAAAAVTSRTVAVVAVHQYGLPAPVAALRAALPPDVALIEDVAQAWDVRSGGRPVGDAGESAVTSFGPSKPVSAGAGGALLSSSPDAAGVSGHAGERFLRRPPMPAPFPEPLTDELVGALDRVDARVARRRQAVAEAVPELLGRGLAVRMLVSGDAASWHRLPVWAPDPAWRDRLVDACRLAGLPAQPPHSIAVGELPMFAAARLEGDTRCADRDRLVLLSTETADIGERVAAALRTL